MHYCRTVTLQTGRVMWLHILLISFVFFVLFVDNCFFWGRAGVFEWVNRGGRSIRNVDLIVGKCHKNAAF